MKKETCYKHDKIVSTMKLPYVYTTSRELQQRFAACSGLVDEDFKGKFRLEMVKVDGAQIISNMRNINNNNTTIYLFISAGMDIRVEAAPAYHRYTWYSTMHNILQGQSHLNRLMYIYSRTCYEQPLLWAANLLCEDTWPFPKMTFSISMNLLWPATCPQRPIFLCHKGGCS